MNIQQMYMNARALMSNRLHGLPWLSGPRRAVLLKIFDSVMLEAMKDQIDQQLREEK